MPADFVSEALTPLGTTFDAGRMACGEPGLPRRFRWRKQNYTVAEVQERWKEYGDCTHGSGERYLRKHGYRVKTEDGWTFRIYFQRHFGKVWKKNAARWWIYSAEAPLPVPAKD